jgi:hypothetical protein
MGVEVGVGGGSGRWEVELGVEVDVEVGVGVGVPRGRCGGLRAAPSPVFLQRSAEGPKWRRCFPIFALEAARRNQISLVVVLTGFLCLYRPV